MRQYGSDPLMCTLAAEAAQASTYYDVINAFRMGKQLTVYIALVYVVTLMT